MTAPPHLAAVVATRALTRATFRKELAVLWLSPVPYVVGGLFHAALGVLAVDLLRARDQAVFQPMIPIIGFLLIAMIPALTMRVFSDELRHGTLDVLLAIPVRTRSLVLGKWLAVFVTVVGISLPASVHAGLLLWWGEPDRAPMVTGALGLLGLMAAATAIGVLASACTASQPIAALSAFFVLLVSWLLEPSTRSVALRTVTARLSISERIRTFAAGGIEIADAAFFLLVTAACLLVAVTVVDMRRLR